MATPSPVHTLPGMSQRLARVEESLKDAVRADDPFLTEVASHLVNAGGKRLRPALAIASGVALGERDGVGDDDLVTAAVAVELVHLGSLYHDDVMDEATTRRKVESVNARWGNLTAILAGDFLLARASELAASLGTEVAGLLAATIGALCEGQVRELRRVYDVTRSEDDYFAAIAGKTAALFASACRIGGIVGDLPRDTVDQLTAFGSRFGVAFQIVDDVLDVVATDEQLGKPAGNDLVEGVYTLPVIRALSANGDGTELAEMLGRPLERAEADRARTLLRSGTAVDDALAVARHHAAQAVEALESLERTETVESMVALATRLTDTVPASA